MIWHFVTGAPKTLWALYEENQLEQDWGSTLLGFIELNEDNFWDCFALKLIGCRPDKESAMKMVQEFVLDKKP